VLEEDHSDGSDGMELDRVGTRRANESRLWQMEENFKKEDTHLDMQNQTKVQS